MLEKGKFIKEETPKIGSAYIFTQKHAISEDELLIQNALLNKLEVKSNLKSIFDFIFR